MNKGTKKLMVVGDVRKAVQAMSDVLGEDVQLTMSLDAHKKWKALEKEYEAFYELPLQERLYKSGMATKPTNTGKKEV